jgi:hypothetical protein
MLILDTNILSAIMGTRPIPEVAVRIAGQPPIESLFTTSITEAEILSGIAIMPESRRRRDLGAAARAMFMDDFGGRVLPFDSQAAAAYADIFAARRRAGRPAGTMDLIIVSVARSRGASVVTRDTGAFEGCGIAVINPWDVSASGP